jgi:hypothetical protein
VIARATVVDRRINTDPSPHPMWSYCEIVYEFVTGRSWDLDLHAGTATVSKSTYDSLRIGDSVTVVYSVGKPEDARLRIRSEPSVQSRRPTGPRPAARLDRLSELFTEMDSKRERQA